MITKFRGFRTKSDEWVEGCLIYREEPYLHDIVVPIGDSSNISYAVDRNSIGQYSGLKDKNGVEIFEGDIVEYFHTPAVIQKVKGGFAIVNTDDYEYITNLNGHMRILGNIYENPELIEVIY